MAAPRGRRSTARAGDAQAPRDREKGSRPESGGLVPEFLRRAVGLGFSGFFTTEELLRKALGDNVPREWAEFAAAQTDRARTELIDRLAQELRKTLDAVDLEKLLASVLESHTIEIDARIRVSPRSADTAEGRDVRVRVRHEDEK
jgi:hypothetical protein